MAADPAATAGNLMQPLLVFRLLRLVEQPAATARR
jgi:hypothetical protein